MGLAILVLFLLAWAIVLGGPMLGRFLRSRQDAPRDPFGDPFAALGRSVERSDELEPGRPRRPAERAADDPGFEVPTAPVPRVDVPMEPKVVSIGADDASVPAKVRRRRAVLALVGTAAGLLLLAVITGSVVLWALQLVVDVLFVAYTVALVRHARPEKARALRSETVVEVLVRSRRFALPALAVVAVGGMVFGGVVLAGGGNDKSNDRAGAAVDHPREKGSASSAAVQSPRTTTTLTAPPTTLPPVTVPTTPSTSPATTRPAFPTRTLPPVTTAPAVAPMLIPAPPPGTQPAAPPTTQPPNVLCVLIQAFC